MKAKEEVERQREEAEVKMSMQVAALNENVATLKREWQSSQRRVGELEKQTDELRGEIAVLEATVQNNQDERRALLERFDGSRLFLGLNKERKSDDHFQFDPFPGVSRVRVRSRSFRLSWWRCAGSWMTLQPPCRSLAGRISPYRSD